jgi:hypothetical protein
VEVRKYNPEMWLRFDFPAGCVLDDQLKEGRRKEAAGLKEGGCCPCYFCFSSKNGHSCDSKTAEECARLCEKFYEKYIKEEGK